VGTLIAVGNRNSNVNRRENGVVGLCELFQTQYWSVRFWWREVRLTAQVPEGLTRWRRQVTESRL